jgi:signal peptidase II
MSNRSNLMTRLPGVKWFLWVPVFFVIDQLSKWVVLKHFSLGEMLPVIPGLHFTLAYNTGVAFSMFSHQAFIAKMALTCFVSAICLVVAYWLVKTPKEDNWSGISLLLILGGALGNLCDRLTHGYVIDFIDFYISTWHFYTFNIADSFITIGAIMMFKTAFFPSSSTVNKG